MSKRPILMGEAERVATQTEPVFSAVFTRQLLARMSKLPADTDRAVSITSKCHRDAGVRAWYQASTGRVPLVCAQCDAPAVWIQVANETPT